MELIKLIDQKKKETKDLNSIQFYEGVKLLGFVCNELYNRKLCIKCPQSFGDSKAVKSDKLNCLFKIKPKDLASYNWFDFIDELLEMRNQKQDVGALFDKITNGGFLTIALDKIKKGEKRWNQTEAKLV